MALYEIVLTESYYEQTCINRWNYISSGTATGITGSAALVAAMGFIPVAGDFVADTIAAKLQELQVESVTFEGMLSKSIQGDPTDFYDVAFPTGVQGGAGALQGLPPFNAWGFRTNRVRSDIGRGTKRFVGVSENAVQSGGAIEAGAAAVMQELADLMSDTLSYTGGGSTLTFTPVVAKKQSYVTDSGKTAYRYFTPLSAQLAQLAEGVTWEIYDNVRSQTSRQYKHGA
jgi:hypothetical protein